MAENKGILLAKSVQKHAGRAKEKLLQNLGKVDRTADEIFDEHLTNFTRQQNGANRLQKEFNNYIRCIRAVQTASKSLMDAINEVYETQWTGSEALYAQSSAVEVLWQDFSHKLGDQVLIPLNTYTSQFPEMKKKVDKRGRKLVDYDSQRHSFQNLQSNAAKRRDDVKVTRGREQLEEAKRTYEVLNSELHDELPALFDSRILFLVTNLQTLFASEQMFHSETSKVYAELEAIVDKLATESQRGSYSLKKITANNSNPSSHPQSPIKANLSIVNNTKNYPPAITNGSTNNGNANGPASSTSPSISPTEHKNNLNNNNINNESNVTTPTINSQTIIEPSYQNTSALLSSTSTTTDTTLTTITTSTTTSTETATTNNLIVNNHNNHNNNNNNLTDKDKQQSQTSNNNNDSNKNINENSSLEIAVPPTTSTSTANATSITTSSAIAIVPPQNTVTVAKTNTATNTNHTDLVVTNNNQILNHHTKNLNENSKTNTTTTATNNNVLNNNNNNNSSNVNSLSNNNNNNKGFLNNHNNNNNNNNNNKMEELYDIPVGATTTDLPPGVLYRVKSTYKYVREDVDELSFDVGDIIDVIEYDDPEDQEEGWLMGVKQGTSEKGMFPANFTRPL
uniref:Putative amphiphysin n=1 Tax=Corethrella appendiculata TaxID=1370023 RepID=U5EZH2_9DIPT